MTRCRCYVAGIKRRRGRCHAAIGLVRHIRCERHGGGFGIDWGSSADRLGGGHAPAPKPLSPAPSTIQCKPTIYFPPFFPLAFVHPHFVSFPCLANFMFFTFVICHPFLIHPTPIPWAAFNNLHLVWSESYPSVSSLFALHRVLSDVKSERRASNMASNVCLWTAHHTFYLQFQAKL